MMPDFTVVVPTYRRPALLLNCLKALAAQQLPREQFEIIVVDDGNDATTAAAVRSFAAESGLETRYLGQPQRRGPAAARNRGWRAARGRIVAFTDDDCLPQPTWLTAALVPFRRGAQVVTGRVKMPLSAEPTAHDRTTQLLETAEFVTANCFCLRTALQRVGGFEETFDIAWREDSDLQFKLMEAGIPITACPEALIVHPLRPAPWYASLKDERKNRYDALLYKRHPALFRQRIPQYRDVVLEYYAAVGGAATGAVGLLTQNGWLTTAGFGIWLLVTTNLTVRRLPDRPTPRSVQQAALTALATPFLSIYWRLYGAVKYRVLYF